MIFQKLTESVKAFVNLATQEGIAHPSTRKEGHGREQNKSVFSNGVSKEKSGVLGRKRTVVLFWWWKYLACDLLSPLR